MEISKASSFTDGADNVIASSLTNGDKYPQTVTIRDEDKVVIDISNYSFDLDVVFGTASADISGSKLKPTVTINSLTLVSDDSTFRSHDGNTGTTKLLPGKDIDSSAVTKTDATNGLITIQWPENLYEGYVPFNTSTHIPVRIATLRYADASTPAAATSIQSIRFLQFVRYGVQVA